MDKMLLISGGDIDYEWAKTFVFPEVYKKIIAVDGGLSAANLLQIVPDIIVGDFDSVNKELLNQYIGNNEIKIEKLNPMKDDTDTQHAINMAVDMGAQEIHIIGGLGSRFDHALANVYMLKMAYERGTKAIMYDRYNKMYIIDGHNHLIRDEKYGKYISFIQLDEPVRNVTMKGFVYDVSNYDFDTAKEYRLGVSNEFADQEAEVIIGNGKFLVVEVAEG